MTSGVLSPNAEALLVALVLVPEAYARNRFYEMYLDSSLRTIRAKAARLRSVVRHLGAASFSANEVHRAQMASGDTRVSYALPHVRAKRTLVFSPLETAILDVAMARQRRESAPAEAEAVVNQALGRLVL